MRVAVTGAAGFLGRSIVRRCSDQGDRVLACVSHRSGQEQELVRRAESVVHTDLAGSFDAAHFDGIDVVFHCAAQVRPAVRAHFLTGNVAVTRNVITAAAEAGVGCVIYFSSVAVHGEHQDHVGTDECGAFCSKPPSPYVESKITAELVAREIACQRNLRLVVLRPAWVWVIAPRRRLHDLGREHGRDARSRRLPSGAPATVDLLAVQPRDDRGLRRARSVASVRASRTRRLCHRRRPSGSCRRWRRCRATARPRLRVVRIARRRSPAR